MPVSAVFEVYLLHLLSGSDSLTLAGEKTKAEGDTGACSGQHTMEAESETQVPCLFSLISFVHHSWPLEQL